MFVGFELLDRGVPRNGYDVFNSLGEKIGVVTSGTMSPSLKKAIGLAYVSKEMKDLDTEIYIAVRNKQLKAKVVSLLFYKNNMAKRNIQVCMTPELFSLYADQKS